MWLKTPFKPLTSTSTRRRPTRRRPPTSRLCLEPLEDRRLLSFSPVVDYPVGPNPQAVTTADFNNDGRLDLAAANSGVVSVLLGNGDGTFQAARTSATGAGPESVLAADLNGDAKIDLVTVNSNYGNGSGGLSVLLGNGDGTFQPPRSVVLPSVFPPGYTGSDPLGQSANAPAIGDLNADGKLDLIAGGWTRYTFVSGYDDYGYPIYDYYTDAYVNVLLGNGDGTFEPGTAYHVSLGLLYGLVLGDFNGDGRTDVVTSYGSGYLGVLRGNGDGTLQDAQQSGVGAWLMNISMPVGDFDGDGRLDLLMYDGTGNFAVPVRGNGDGTFRQGEYVYTGTTISAAVVS
jgi:FG-GAP-like repeat